MVTQAPGSATDHYAVLGVDPDASAGEVAEAYRQAAKRLHPDRDGGDAARFRDLGIAWEVLRDPERRAEYDRWRTERPATRPASRRTGIGARRLPNVPTRRASMLLVWAGAACMVLGIAAAAWTAALVSDSASFRSGSIATTGVIVGGPDGTEVRFTTDDGDEVLVPKPDSDNPGVAGDSLAIRYDENEPTIVRVDESTAARDITVGIVAAKLLIGGPVLIVVGARRLRRLPA